MVMKVPFLGGFYPKKNVSIFPTQKKKKKIDRIFGRPSGRNFGHPLDRKHIFFKGGLKTPDIPFNAMLDHQRLVEHCFDFDNHNLHNYVFFL